MKILVPLSRKVPAPYLATGCPPASVMAALIKRSTEAAPSATVRLRPVPAPPSARRLIRPAIFAVSALAKVVTCALRHSSRLSPPLSIPLLLCRVPPVISTPPAKSHTCMTPAVVTVPPLIINLESLAPFQSCQPKPVPSPVVTAVAPALTVSVPRIGA